MENKTSTIYNKAGKIPSRRLLIAIETFLKQETVAVHRLHGKAQLSAAVEALTAILNIGELLESYSLELRGQIGLRASPMKQDQSVEDLKAMKNKIT